jgi:hypothetical protein
VDWGPACCGPLALDRKVLSEEGDAVQFDIMLPDRGEPPSIFPLYLPAKFSPIRHEGEILQKLLRNNLFVVEHCY